MSPLAYGLYEILVHEALAKRLTSDQSLEPTLSPLRDAEAAERIALHLASVVERAIESLPDGDRATIGAKIARRLIAELAKDPKAENLLAVQLVEPPQVLRAIPNLLPDGRPEEIPSPLIPLLDTALLTNAPGEPRVGR